MGEMVEGIRRIKQERRKGCEERWAGVDCAWGLHAEGRPPAVGGSGTQPADRGRGAATCRRPLRPELGRARALLASRGCRNNHPVWTRATTGLARQAVVGGAFRVPDRKSVV